MYFVIFSVCKEIIVYTVRTSYTGEKYLDKYKTTDESPEKGQNQVKNTKQTEAKEMKS